MVKKQLDYISSLDLLRGLAAVAVCFFHFTHGNPGFLSEDNILYQAGRYGFLGVDVFFVISGFVIPYSMHRAGYTFSALGRFLGKRFVRIEPPYLLSIILVLALNWISTLSPYYRGSEFSIDFTQLVLHFGYLNAFFGMPWLNDVYWTLAIEFQYYLIIALVFPLLTWNNKTVYYIFLLVFALLGFLIDSHSFIFNYSLLFIVGILLFQFRIGYLKKNEFGALLLIALMLIFIKFDKRYLVAALLPYFFIMYFDFKGKIAAFLGNISYSLYLVHIPIGGRIINISEVLFADALMRDLMVFAALAISIFSAWLFYLFIEKPAIRWAKRIKYKEKGISP